jgi:cellulose synthase/poly-beta-1,6-N-acetylglucosamine synthase-like glycosyltransferase
MPEYVIFTVLYYLLIYMTLFISVFWFTVFFDNRKEIKKDPAKPKNIPSLTMIIPAYNEEKGLEKTIDSVLGQNYPRNKLKIIIVDDASTDGTLKIAEEYAKKHKNIRVLRHTENRRKAAALNTALKHVETELVGFLDGDTILEKNSLLNSIAYFSKKETGSVIATIKPLSTKTFSQKLQRIEYTFSALVRKLLTFMGALYITPAFALYRTNIVKQLNGWDENNFTEDLEMGLKLQSNGYKIEVSMNAVVKTNTPASFSKFWSQRIRWARGFVYNSKKYTNMFFGRKLNHLGWFILPSQYIIILLSIPVFLYGFYSMIDSAYNAFVNYYFIDFDLPYILAHPFSLGFSYFNASLFVVTLMSLALLIRLGSKQIKENINKLEYVLYIPLYPIINIMIWLSVFYHEIRRSEYKW